MAKKKIKKGSKAPDFTLPDEHGQPVRLYDVLAQGPVMLVFYPGAFTPVCTAQLCSYRDSAPEFDQYDIQILGISADDADKQAAFATKKKFSFPLLTDPDHTVINTYSGTSILAGGRPSRANYIIARDGTVLYAHTETVSLTHRKAPELIEVLGELRKAGKL